MQEKVALLLMADTIENIDSVMASIQVELRKKHNQAIVDELCLVIRGQDPMFHGVDHRTLALKTLAGVRSNQLCFLVACIIRWLCTFETDGDLLFSAIASATHLTVGGKRAIQPSVRKLEKRASPRLQQAILAFRQEARRHA